MVPTTTTIQPLHNCMLTENEIAKKYSIQIMASELSYLKNRETQIKQTKEIAKKCHLKL